MKARPRKRLCHQNGRVTVAAAHVGDRDAGLEPLDDAVERGQPLRHQAGPIAVAVESRHAAVQAAVVIAPGDALAGAKGLEGPFLVEPHRYRHLPCGRDEHRAILVGQHHRLLGRQLVGVADGVVVHVATRGLCVQPLAHIALGAAGAVGELPGAERAGARHGFVESELAAEADHDAAVGGGQVADGAHDKRLQLRLIDLGCVHRTVPLLRFRRAQTTRP